MRRNDPGNSSRKPVSLSNDLNNKTKRNKAEEVLKKYTERVQSRAEEYAEPGKLGIQRDQRENAGRVQNQMPPHAWLRRVGRCSKLQKNILHIYIRRIVL